MRGLRQAVGMVAIFAIALHGLLLGLAPLAAAANDPFTVICHSAPQSTSGQDQSPVGPDTGFHGCDHCNLCSATSTPLAVDGVLAGQLRPVRVLQVLRPISTAATASLATTPKLARGPPAFA
jgi:DUF2946 family protein